jgi:hypothetical protein
MATVQRQLVGRRGRVALGLFLVAMPIVLGYLLLAFWPTQAVDASGTLPPGTISILGITSFKLDAELQLMAVVILTAGIGGYIHAATSFATYVGNRQLYQSWVWWYVLRTFIGSGLAIIFYFALRGGLLTANSGAENVNPFGVSAVGGLTGLFSKQATDKLREVFQAMFRTEQDDQRADKLQEDGTDESQKDG